MHRRAFLAGSVALLAAPLGVKAQTAGKVYRVGIVVPGAPAPSDRVTISFLVPAVLRELGYVEGQNLLVERRYAGGKRDRLPGLARIIHEDIRGGADRTGKAVTAALEPRRHQSRAPIVSGHGRDTSSPPRNGGQAGFPG